MFGCPHAKVVCCMKGPALLWDWYGAKWFMHFVLPMCHIVERVELCIVCGSNAQNRTHTHIDTGENKSFSVSEYVTNMDGVFAPSALTWPNFLSLTISERYLIYLKLSAKNQLSFIVKLSNKYVWISVIYRHNRIQKQPLHLLPLIVPLSNHKNHCFHVN